MASRKNWGKRLIFAAVAIAIATPSVGCINYATMQSADVVESGKIRSGTGIVYTPYAYGDEYDVMPFPVPRVPAFYGWIRAGLANSFEVHTDFWIPLGASIGTKYQFVGEPGLPGPRLATGLDAGFAARPAGSDSPSVFNAHLPLYLAVRSSDMFSTYLVPKYNLRTVIPDEGPAVLRHLPGGTLGVQIGLGESGTEMNIEGTWVYDLTDDGHIFTFGFGVSKLM